MPLKSIFRRSPPKGEAKDVYRLVLGRSREPVFYRDLGVPDTVDGRFEMVALYAFLVLRRLKGEAEAAEFGQELFDVMFDDMDWSLREMGAGDMGVGKRVKAMVQAFYGRVAAYDKGMAGEGEIAGEGLRDALVRNLYRTAQPAPETVARMAEHIWVEARHLASIDTGRITSADFAFGDLP